MVLVDEQLQEHMAGLASTPRATDIRYLFDASQVSGLDITLDGHIRNLKTLADDFFFRDFAHKAQRNWENFLIENNSHFKNIHSFCQQVTLANDL